MQNAKVTCLVLWASTFLSCLLYGSSLAPISKTKSKSSSFKAIAQKSKDLDTPHTVIVLFGPSGAGKTRLSKKLRKKLNTYCQKAKVREELKHSWKRVAVDNIPDEKVEEYKDSASLTAENLAVIATILEKAQRHNVVCDTVLQDEKEANAFIETLSKKHKAYFVLVHCSLDELIKRSAERKHKAQTDSEFDRDPISPFTQYRNLFSPVEDKRSQSTQNLSAMAKGETTKTKGSPRIHSKSCADLDEASKTDEKRSGIKSAPITPSLESVSKDQVEKACSLAIPALPTAKKGRTLSDKDKKKAEFDAKAHDYAVKNFMSGFEAFTAGDKVDVIPNPNIKIDLVVKNTTAQEAQQAVDQIMKLVFGSALETPIEDDKESENEASEDEE